MLLTHLYNHSLTDKPYFCKHIYFHIINGLKKKILFILKKRIIYTTQQIYVISKYVNLNWNKFILRYNRLFLFSRMNPIQEHDYSKMAVAIPIKQITG